MAHLFVRIALMSACLIGSTSTPVLAQEEGAAQEPEIVISATPPRNLMRRIVRTSDLDLATEAGRRELQRRVEAAVQSLCFIPSPIGYYEPVMSQPCREEAWASAQPQIDRQLRRTPSPGR
ncbi:MAG TPA: UrcA family protein [Allosphingosinicella sp.]|nr:UrcA family protein [Allosphingosinicella sp.]